MAACSKNNLKSTATAQIAIRNDVLLTVAATAFIIGIFFALPARLLDVMLIFTVCLTAAAVMITIPAQQPAQVQGFPWLVVFATSLRITIISATVKILFTKGSVGVIAYRFGRIFIRGNNPAVFLVFFLFAVVLFVFICLAIKKIIRSSSAFIIDTAARKQIAVNSNLSAGLIDKKQAIALKENIDKETSFFTAGRGVGRFMFCVAMFELAVIIAGITISIMFTLTNSAGPSANIYTASVIGAGLVIQLSELVMTVAYSHLISKCSTHSGSCDWISQQPSGKKVVKVVEVEIVNENDRGVSQLAAGELTGESVKADSTADTENIQQANISNTNWSDEQSHRRDEKADLPLWNWRRLNDSNGYEAVSELIEKYAKSDKLRIILMAAENTADLGVTVPVNTAMRLAQKANKCLLIDLDIERSAVSKVFDITNSNDKQIHPTCISNLWIMPADKLYQNNKINLAEIIENIRNQYDYVIIYVPNIKLPANYEQLTEHVDSAMLFGERTEDENSVMKGLHFALSCSGCRIFKPVSGY